MAKSSSKRKRHLNSYSSGFLNFEFLNEGAHNYYNQFSKDESHTLESFNAKNEVVASLEYYIKTFYQGDSEEPIKILILANLRSMNSREAYLAWSEDLLPKVLEVKKQERATYVLFLLSRRFHDSFKYLIRPRRRKKDQLRFNHLRTLDVQMIQGRRLFAEAPLEHVHIRRAKHEDLKSIAGYIKRATQKMPLTRLVDEGALLEELEKWEGLKVEDLALALSHDEKIVGILGSFSPQNYLKASLDLDEVKDSVFFVLQSFLKLGSYVRDLRPAFNKNNLNFRFFTHIYSNNKDIFYSLVDWWLNETRQDRPVFLYPHFKGELLTLPSGSLFSPNFGFDLYLMQEPDDAHPSILKPHLYTSRLDIDLPFLF